MVTRNEKKRQGPTMRVDERTRHAVQELAKAQGISQTQVLARAVEHYRRELMLQRANAEWAAVQRDPKAAADIAAEDELLEGTLSDGLEDPE
jgi:hypothetical protein